MSQGGETTTVGRSGILFGIGLATLPVVASAQTRQSAIIVNGILPARDDTYRVRDVAVGPLGDKPLLDTPYSISVVPVNLAENQQLQNVRELFRYIPSVQGENIRPQARGLQAGVAQNLRIDGFNIAATTDYPIPPDYADAMRKAGTNLELLRRSR